MVGTNNETNFDINEYEKFYEHHYFAPTPEQACTDINEYIPRFSWAFDQIETLSPKSLLDLGCLDGSFALTVGRHLGIPVTGVDLTEEGISLAKERAKRFLIDATFRQGTVEKFLMTCIDNEKTYDAITLFELIEHVKDVPLLLSLIDRVLSPGGSVLVSTPSFESPQFGADDEKNKCHIRLYTTKRESYDKVNKFGTNRHATSIYEEVRPDRIKEVAVHNELINFRYQ